MMRDKKEIEHKLDDIINLSNSKVKSSAKDIDRVVYGL